MISSYILSIMEDAMVGYPAFHDSVTFHNMFYLLLATTLFCVQKIGLIVRVASVTTESVYKFLRQQLAPLEPMIGVPPYR
jgi:urease accessory protein